MERKWIVSAFVDIRGFGTWIYRASIPAEVKEPFIEQYLNIYQAYSAKNRANHFKYLGDGFLVVKEFEKSKNKSREIFGFIKGLRCVTRKIIALIKSSDEGPPGVRVRITEGYSYKIMLEDPFDLHRRRSVPEYIEYGINTAERLMEVNPEIICVVTEGVGKSLGKYRSFFRMRPLGTPSHTPKSVNQEDLQTLQVLRF